MDKEELYHGLKVCDITLNLFEYIAMKKILTYLFLLILVSCSNVDDVSDGDSASMQSRSAGTDLYPDEWGIQNMIQSGRYVDYEFVYKNTPLGFTYICSSAHPINLGDDNLRPNCPGVALN